MSVFDMRFLFRLQRCEGQGHVTCTAWAILAWLSTRRFNLRYCRVFTGDGWNLKVVLTRSERNLLLLISLARLSSASLSVSFSHLLILDSWRGSVAAHRRPKKKLSSSPVFSVCRFSVFSFVTKRCWGVKRPIVLKWNCEDENCYINYSVCVCLRAHVSLFRSVICEYESQLSNHFNIPQQK